MFFSFKATLVRLLSKISESINNNGVFFFTGGGLIVGTTRATGVVLISAALAWGCANTGFPTGGPKDVTPPVVVSSTPAPNALNFKGQEIIIKFDEIIQVKEIFQKLVVSPPVNRRPVVAARARELVVRFDEELQPNTTYTIDFADAIRDNNEGNILDNFRFSFSTGEVVDSLSISGHLFDAANLAPVAGALVMIHANLADSAFKKMVPIRLAKTNQDGAFSILNIAPGEYRVFALEDANRDYIYNQPGERVAWHSQLVVPTFEYRERVDSIAPDSFKIHEYNAFLPDSLELFLFHEDNIPQYMKDNKRDTRNKIDLVFNRGNSRPVDISLLGKPERDNWFIYERSFAHDSITVWLTDSTEIMSDSLFITVGYQVLDSLGDSQVKTDTLNAFFFQTSQVEPRQRRGDQPAEVPTLKPAGMKPILEILSDFDLLFPTPVNKYDLSRIKLFQLVDTIPHPIDFNLLRDSIRVRRFIVSYPWEPGVNYKFTADSAAFIDVYGLVSSPINQSFTVKPIESYGIIFIDVANPGENWLMQILNRQEQLVRQAMIPANGKIGFQFLRPGDYWLRIVEDTNRNGVWDTGNFSQAIQPERLMYFPEAINVRANWDRLVNWDPSVFDIHDFVKRNRKKTVGAPR